MKISVPPRLFMASPAPGLGKELSTRTQNQPTSSNEPAQSCVDEPRHALLGLVRQLRAEIQNLESSLLLIEQQGKIQEAQTRATELTAALSMAHDLFQSNCPQIELVLDEVRALLQARPALLDWCSDEFTRIENLWERALYHWPGQQLTEHEVCLKVDKVLDRFEEIIYLCGLITVPDRVREHLSTLRVGQGLNFEAYFKDELSQDDARNRRARSRLLRYLCDHPNVVEGVVDTGKGVIFHASNKPRRRILSYALELGLVLLGFGLAYLLSELPVWLQIGDWPGRSGQAAVLMTAYGFLVAGAFSHILVDTLKQVRKDDGTGLLALQDWLLWLHVKETPIIGAILSLWGGLLALVFVVGSLDWRTAFFVGYSIDSVMDLFLDRFTQAATAKAKAIEKQLKQGAAA